MNLTCADVAAESLRVLALQTAEVMVASAPAVLDHAARRVAEHDSSDEDDDGEAADAGGATVSARKARQARKHADAASLAGARHAEDSWWLSPRQRRL